MLPMDARRMHLPLESVHVVVYYAPETAAAYAALGLKSWRMGYFASRAAPLGLVSPQVVTAAFYNFCPAAIARSIPGAWTRTTPELVLAARLSVADSALRRILGDGIAASEVTEAAALARDAAQACPVDGRPLFAGHASLPWPEAPHLVLWHAATLLREYRGDGHIAALLGSGVCGIDALVMHAAMAGAPAGLLASRQWADEDVDGARARLLARGWIDSRGAPTVSGQGARQEIELHTDELAMAPWEAIGADGCDRLHSLLVPLATAIDASRP